MPEASQFGLSDELAAKIRETLAACPRIERAVLYGSRAKGNFRPGSDIDLTLTGTLTYADLLAVERALDDLSLPYRFDLSVFGQIENPDLIAHIKRVGVVFWERSPRPSDLV